jgi:predicted acyl esterase
MHKQIPIRKINTRAALVLLLGLFFIHGQVIGQDQVVVAGNIQIKEVWIPLQDGTNLAVDLYTSVDMKKTEKLPVILEYLPYRKDEGRSGRLGTFAYFVEHGYVVARVDMRGTGRSEGKLVDGEYSEQEQLDGEEIIDWLSRQDFSTGNIAMFGISWGGLMVFTWPCGIHLH